MPTDEEELLAAFVASMPAAYRSVFDDEAMRVHAGIVQRRGERPAQVEIWRELPERVLAVCVVADDKPGLFSSMTAALVAERIDVVSAHAFCRTREDGAVEAIDFLWLRRLPSHNGSIPPIRPREFRDIAVALERAATEDNLGITSERITSVRPTTAGAARVRFDTNEETGSTILTVEAVDRPGLLLAVTQALFRAGLQIIGLRATTEQGCAVDRFELTDIDGSPLRKERIFALQIAILGAIEEGTLAVQRRSAG